MKAVAKTDNLKLKEIPNSPVFLAGLDTNFTYANPPHIKLIEKHLLMIYNGEINRLIINMPPNHGKSELASRYFPAWWFINRPDSEIIFSTYAADVAANDMGMRVRSLVNEFGYLNPNEKISINTSSNAKDRFNIDNHRGVYHAVGVGGQINSRHADLFLIDDPVKGDEAALSEVQREKIWNWYRGTMRHRLNPGAAIVIIMTRWHYDDLVGRILANTKEEWTVLNLPAISDGNNDMLDRPKGSALWEGRFPIESLIATKQEIGSFWWSALFQQEPIASEFQILKRKYWQKFTNDQIGKVLQCWDTAHEKGKNNDFSACTTWVLNDNGFFMIDGWKEKLLYPDLREKVIDKYNAFEPDILLVENASSGRALIQDLKRYTRLPIRAVETCNKELRAHIVSPLFENHKVFIKDASWAEEIIEECEKFPAGKHDDYVDSVTIALEYMKKLKPEKRLNGSHDETRPRPQIKKQNYFTNY